MRTSRSRWGLGLIAVLGLACGGRSDSESNADGAPAGPSAPSVAEVAAGGSGAEASVMRAPLPVSEALATYQAECLGSDDLDCKQLQWQLEWALYLDLRALARNGPIEDELIRAAASADCPQLKAFGLERLASRSLQPGEDSLVIAAFDDPYPLVRAVAHQLARELPDPAWARMLGRDAGLPAEGAAGLTAAVTPDEKALGAKLYPRARHWHFASSAEFGEYFTTEDAPAQVIAFYAKEGRRALRGDELEAEIQAAKDGALDPALVMQRMQDALAAGQDPATAMSALSAGGTGVAVDWEHGIDGSEGVVEPRYVVLASEELFGHPVPSRVVAIFRDELMGKTALVFRSKPPLPTPPDLSTPEAVKAYTELQQWQASPDARRE